MYTGRYNKLDNKTKGSVISENERIKQGGGRLGSRSGAVFVVAFLMGVLIWVWMGVFFSEMVMFDEWIDVVCF